MWTCNPKNWRFDWKSKKSPKKSAKKSSINQAFSFFCFFFLALASRFSRNATASETFRSRSEMLRRMVSSQGRGEFYGKYGISMGMEYFVVVVVLVLVMVLVMVRKLYGDKNISDTEVDSQNGTVIA